MVSTLKGENTLHRLIQVKTFSLWVSVIQMRPCLAGMEVGATNLESSPHKMYVHQQGVGADVTLELFFGVHHYLSCVFNPLQHLFKRYLKP